MKYILTDEGYVSPVLPRIILPPQLFLPRQLLLHKLLGHQFHPPILVDLQGSNKPHSLLKSINFPLPMVAIFILISTYICLVLILAVRDTGASFTLGRKYLQNFWDGWKHSSKELDLEVQIYKHLLPLGIIVLRMIVYDGWGFCHVLLLEFIEVPSVIFISLLMWRAKSCQKSMSMIQSRKT